MATIIRMKRGGRTHAPYYRVVVSDSRAKATGRVIEELGIYHPCARPEPLVEVNRERAIDWLSKGAQPSDTVRNVLTKLGIMAEFEASKRGGAPIAQTDAPTGDSAEAPTEAPAAEAVETE